MIAVLAGAGVIVAVAVVAIWQTRRVGVERSAEMWLVLAGIIAAFGATVVFLMLVLGAGRGEASEGEAAPSVFSVTDPAAGLHRMHPALLSTGSPVDAAPGCDAVGAAD